MGDQELVSAGPPKGNQELESAGQLTEDQAGLVAAPWCWDDALGHWAVQSLRHWVAKVADDIRSADDHVSLCGLHKTP